MVKKYIRSYIQTNENNQVEITNKPLFYTGLSMQIAPLIIIGILVVIWGISKLDFTWIIEVINVLFEPAKLYGYAIISGVILYYITSIFFIKEGTKK